MKNIHRLTVVMFFVAALFALTAVTTNAQTMPNFVPADYAGKISVGRVPLPANASYPSNLFKEDLAAMRPSQIYHGSSGKVYELPATGHAFQPMPMNERYFALVEYDPDLIKGDIFHTEPFEVKVDVTAVGKAPRMKTTKVCFVVKEIDTGFTAEKLPDGSLAPYADEGCNNPLLAVGIPPARFVGLTGGSSYNGGGTQQPQQQGQQQNQQQQQQGQQQGQNQNQNQNQNQKQGRGGFDLQDGLEIVGGALLGGLIDHFVLKGGGDNTAIATATNRNVFKRKVVNNNYPPPMAQLPPKTDDGSPRNTPVRRGYAALSRELQSSGSGNGFAQTRPATGGVAMNSLFQGRVIERVRGRAVSGNEVPTTYTRSNGNPLQKLFARSTNAQQLVRPAANQRVVAGSLVSTTRSADMDALFGHRRR